MEFIHYSKTECSFPKNHQGEADKTQFLRGELRHLSVTREDFRKIMSGDFSSIKNPKLKSLFEQERSFRTSMARREVATAQVERNIIPTEVLAAHLDKHGIEGLNEKALPIDPGTLIDSIPDDEVEIFFLAEREAPGLDAEFAKIQQEMRRRVSTLLHLPPDDLRVQEVQEVAPQNEMVISRHPNKLVSDTIISISAAAALVFLGFTVKRMMMGQPQESPPPISAPNTSPAPEPPLPKLVPVERPKPPAQEAKEQAQPKTAIEIVLEKSLPIYLEETRTYRDNILDAHAVSEYFYEGRFRYTGSKPNVNYNGKKTRALRFAVIGEKSGYLGRKGKGKELEETTTLPELIRIFFGRMNHSQAVLQKYIVWVYQESFGVTLEPSRIRIEKDGIYYDAPKHFDAKARITASHHRWEDAPTQPGGNLSKHTEPQNVLDPQKRLLLPKGISPLHDIVVPVELMDPNPTITVRLNGYGTWVISAAELAEDITRFEQKQRNKKNHQRVDVTAFGRRFSMEKIGPLVELNDPHLKELAGWLLKDIPDDREKILRLTRFVQDFPYEPENDADIDRPGFITIVNGQGDCNNSTILWVQLMLAAGFDTAFIYSDDRRDNYSSHVLGGIPERYFPGEQSWSDPANPKNRFVAVELSGKKGSPPGQPIMGEDQEDTVTFVEPLRAKKRS